MRARHLMPLALMLTGLISFSLHAQEGRHASGGEATGSGGFVSYSIGQVFYLVKDGSSGSVAEGVQQPYEISVITSLPGGREIELAVSVYPNPATDLLTLHIGVTHPGLRYRLTDLLGQVIAEAPITDNETLIPVGQLARATYLLSIIDDKSELRVFSIIKN